MLKIKNFKTNKTIFTLLLCIVLTSCSVPREARKTAEFVSTKIVQLEKNSGKFSKSRLKIAQVRKRNMNSLENNAIETERYNETELGLWNLGNIGTKEKNKRILLYEFIRDTSQNAYHQHLEYEKNRNDQEKFVSNMKSVVNFKSKKLTETAEFLSVLSKEPDILEQLEFLYAFGKNVSSTVNELAKAAEESANAKESENEKGDE